MKKLYLFAALALLVICMTGCVTAPEQGPKKPGQAFAEAFPNIDPMYWARERESTRFNLTVMNPGCEVDMPAGKGVPIYWIRNCPNDKTKWRSDAQLKEVINR